MNQMLGDKDWFYGKDNSNVCILQPNQSAIKQREVCVCVCMCTCIGAREYLVKLASLWIEMSTSIIPVTPIEMLD